MCRRSIYSNVFILVDSYIYFPHVLFRTRINTNVIIHTVAVCRRKFTWRWYMFLDNIYIFTHTLYINQLCLKPARTNILWSKCMLIDNVTSFIKKKADMLFTVFSALSDNTHNSQHPNTGVHFWYQDAYMSVIIHHSVLYLTQKKRGIACMGK